VDTVGTHVLSSQTAQTGTGQGHALRHRTTYRLLFQLARLVLSCSPRSTAMASHRAWRLRSRPVGALKDTDLELCVEAAPVPKPGNLLVRNLYLSIDPTHRIWMSDRPQVRGSNHQGWGCFLAAAADAEGCSRPRSCHACCCTLCAAAARCCSCMLRALGGATSQIRRSASLQHVPALRPSGRACPQAATRPLYPLGPSAR